MQVLLVAATPFEIAPLTKWLEEHFKKNDSGRFVRETLEVQLCITGVGMMATAWHLADSFARQKPDFAINAGIAGALDPGMKIGYVYMVSTERLADLGVEDADGQFLDLSDIGLGGDEFPFKAGKMMNPGAESARFLPKAEGITVNKAHGSATSIAALRKKYPEAQIESMEGAAFFYSCLRAGVPFAEIRAVSNYVEPRNREAWNLPLAIQSLNEVLRQMLESSL